MKNQKEQEKHAPRKTQREKNKEILQQVYENVSRETFYKTDELINVLGNIDTEQYLIKTKGIELYNIPFSFDIETYSFYDNGEKRACMYVFMFSFMGICFVGRTWQEFDDFVLTLSRELGLFEKRQIFCYVHNLSYEFQWIMKRFTWLKVFAVDERKPVYALSDLGINFRCSYILSGYSLAKVAEHLQYKIEKLDTLDYKLARHSKTPLTDDEIRYCLNDVKIVVLYLAELLQTEYNLNTMPITKTGFVRRFVQNSCFKDAENPKNPFKRLAYMQLMEGLTLTVDEYKQLKRAFQGGFTHASAWQSGKTLENVASQDETSAYPCMMFAYQFPMSKPEHITIKDEDEFAKNLTLYCCCFDIYFEDLEAITTYENYISVSKCFLKEGVDENNGRIVNAKKIWTTITEQDFIIINKMYTWRTMKVSNFIRFRRGYLPRDFVKAVLTLYEDKTTLKGVIGQEQEYQYKKEMLNSCYGMTVTDPIRTENTYTDTWIKKIPQGDELTEKLDKYNKNKNRFIYYPWGVWVCCYNRARALGAILEIGKSGDYVYTDTDSVKYLHPENHKEYFEKDNEKMRQRLQAACDFHHLSFSYITPKTNKGQEKMLGAWDYEGTYDRFKAIRAKTYMYENDGKVNITVSGLNKKVTVPYLEETYKTNDAIFEAFKDGLHVPPEATGKNTHTYIDREVNGTLIDFMGNEGTYHEMSFVHLEEGSYDLSLKEEYIKYICTFAEESSAF